MNKIISIIIPSLAISGIFSTSSIFAAGAYTFSKSERFKSPASNYSEFGNFSNNDELKAKFKPSAKSQKLASFARARRNQELILQGIDEKKIGNVLYADAMRMLNEKENKKSQEEQKMRKERSRLKISKGSMEILSKKGELTPEILKKLTEQMPEPESMLIEVKNPIKSSHPTKVKVPPLNLAQLNGPDYLRGPEIESNAQKSESSMIIEAPMANPQRLSLKELIHNASIMKANPRYTKQVNQAIERVLQKTAPRQQLKQPQAIDQH
ncbi:hypothetical protein [Candidatus Hydrogenosomobacter endosymbioticus]|uniref:Periplasmic protein n=1 Tax=Candidatus Hydrogenosomobacter endosymbioticus TaxID=2558174 RepID=A0ABN6L238_9PROT|nr:hypothetical protein [Candidatus Hydrogenosomobacter endosymbioticus]BDB95899.1 hypothetical protein HYD_0320 [Candidatus Hydrogenosomobacter endosymbioticus]